MKLVLAEDRSGQLHGERAFTRDVVLVGRDPAVCHYFFSQEQWPMVSRKHAEFRLADGKCTVADANSRFGIFINGERVSAAEEVRVGDHVQLGAGGPILRVVSIEQSPADDDAPRSDIGRLETVHDASLSNFRPAPPQPPAPASPSRASSGNTAHLDLEESRAGQTRRIVLAKEVTRLGRDPEGEVVIDADAAVVSRRHAEIRIRDGQYTITDLKSFNGTLVNGQRITETVQLCDGDQIQLGSNGPRLRLTDPSQPAPTGRIMQPGAPTPSQPLIPSAFGQIAAMAQRQTIVSTSGSLQSTKPATGAQPQLLARLSFDNRPELSVGRA